MKKLKGIILGVLVFGLIVGGIVYWQVNQKIEDPTAIESELFYRTDEILAMNEDNVNNLDGKMITVAGIVLASQGDDLQHTITLGANEMESIICQVDNRHLAELSKLGIGQFVHIKGKVTGHDFDEMLGKSVQMKNCVLAQPK